ncbi:MAG TPA: sensor domain-containing diguanylate cyclase [Thauera sp.]|nr:sensor domain-containing diguanylate cyclase [Thauera sp.]HHW65310.1 diguanylate cyclase [Rhodocyclaceae bacterium]
MKWGRKAADNGEADLLAEVAAGVHGIEAVFDSGLRLRWISPSIERMTGFSPQACLAAQDVFDLLVFESDRDFCRRMVGQVLADGLPQDFELRLATHDGRTVWVAAHWRRRAAGAGLRLSAEDIGARKQTEYTLLETVAELRRAQALREHYLLRSNDERQRLAALLNLIRLGILFMDQDRRVLYHNRAMLEIWGYPPETQLVGSREAVLKERAAMVVAEPEAYFAHIDEAVRERSVASEEYEIRFVDGRIVTDRSAVVRGGDDVRSIGRVWIYEDVTSERRTSERLVELAERDELTGLYNRRRFHEELERWLADAARRGTEVGLLSFDLDGFKPVNDSFGHQAGDEVLVGMARAVGRIVRRNEMFFRIGGDEFAVLVPGSSAEGLLELAHRLVETVSTLTFRFGGTTVGVTASVGIARFPENAADAETLVAAADAALYLSKSEGRNRATVSARPSGESARMPASSSDERDSRED